MMNLGVMVKLIAKDKIHTSASNFTLCFFPVSILCLIGKHIARYLSIDTNVVSFTEAKYHSRVVIT